MSLTIRTIVGASLVLSVAGAAVRPNGVAFLGVNASEGNHKYGKRECKCVGIDNLKGYFAMSYGNGYYMQYPIEVGASCQAWEKGRDKACTGDKMPDWCKAKWCYVDPCSCDLPVPPKVTMAGVTYKGSPAYWTYNTCGGKDTWSTAQKMETCVAQDSKKKCNTLSKCAWNGKKCMGKELVKTCKAETILDATIHGKEDCRCIGHGGKIGQARMSIDSKREGSYSADVGGSCKAWEETAHPDCKKEGKKPAWCSQKWCFVDPCTCKTKTPPKQVMKSNSALNFQGMTAHWSYETCGSVDAWSADNKEKYCPTQKSSQDCNKLGKCTWTGKECMSKEVADLCFDDSTVKSSAVRVGIGAFLMVLVGLY